MRAHHNSVPECAEEQDKHGVYTSSIKLPIKSLTPIPLWGALYIIMAYLGTSNDHTGYIQHFCNVHFPI